MSKKRRKLSSARYNDAYNDRDKGGASKQSFIDWKAVPGKRGFYEVKKGKQKLNIIPFEVKSKKNPLVSQKRITVGDLDYMLDIWVHKNVGPNNAQHVCLKKNYGKHCPSCDEVSKYYDEDDTDTARVRIVVAT